MPSSRFSVHRRRRHHDRSNSTSAIAVVASLTLLSTAAHAQGVASPQRIYGDVAVSPTRIAFTYDGQLYDVARAGGTARRLSTTPDAHFSPVYSPDGEQLAYARGTAVWVMPSDGGAPRRLTWHPKSTRPRDFSPDGRTLLVVSSRDGDGNMNGFTVPVGGGPERPLAIDPVRFASYSPDGQHLALVARTTFLGGVDRRFYRGGARDPIQLVDPITGRGRTIPTGSANAIFPMWIGGRVYFASDSLGSFNLAVYDTLTKHVRLLTRYRSHGIVAAADGGGAIVFVRDGRIHLFDVATEAITTPTIGLPVDAAIDSVRAVPAAPFVQFVSTGGRNARWAIESRGEVLVVDATNGEVRTLSNTPGVAERQPTLSPDGARIAYFTDESGEYALAVRDADGRDPVTTIALGTSPTYFRGLTWSPDGRRVAFSDQRLVLWVADVAARTATPIDSSRWIAQGLWQTSWSPDGRLLAYARANAKGVRSVTVRDMTSGQSHVISRDGSDDVWPVFDPSGRWLFFASSSNSGHAPARDVWSLMSDMFAQPFVSHSIVVTTLRPDDVLPVLPFNAGRHPGASSAPTGGVNLAGAAARAMPLAFPTRTIDQLWMSAGGALVVQATVWPSGAATDNAASEVLLVDPVTAARPQTIAANVRSADVSSDGATLIVSRADGYAALPLTGVPDVAKAAPVKLDLSTATVRVEPRREWAQMYHEAFRMMRDYFYDPAHHGADVRELESHYAAYLPHLTRRASLNDLLVLAFGEISISHLGVSGGDAPSGGSAPERTGLLGADYSVENGRFRFRRILRNGPYQSDNPLTRAPLAQPGVDVREGDYLLAVDGADVLPDKPVDFYLVGKAARPTTIRVAATPDGTGARDVIVVPSPGENGLRRANWAEANRQEVERRSNGKLAYVYIDAWSLSGITDFMRVLNGSPNAQGLIIDERYNGGGITADAAIDMLTRKPLYDYLYRYGVGFAVPHHAITGPKVLITHESNGSAAETFAMMFQERGVGTIVGRRTYGGGIGGALYYQRLVDGGRITIPNRASYNSRLGEWGIENRGVVPDIEVVLTQEDAVRGRDPQLQRAIDVALQQLKTFTPRVARRPAPAVHPPRR